VKAKAAAFIQINRKEDLLSSYKDVASFNQRLVLGGGSNILFVGNYEGLVIYPQLKGLDILYEDETSVRLGVSASEVWHDFVEYCLENEYFGLENLALIPGSVGASPVQNIGAYGVEVASFIESVECFDFVEGEFINLSNTQCEFGYRESFIKRAGQGRYLVTRVVFNLSKQFNPDLSYKPLADHFANCKNVSARELFDRVCQIRRKKLPNPDELANAGSFFKNPIIEEGHYRRLKRKHVGLVAYPVKNESLKTYKLAAGWLIEKAGFKGKVFGKVGVHKKQALVLVNYSDHDGQNIVNLAHLIIRKIRELFGVTLEPEVRILGSRKLDVSIGKADES